MKQVIKRDGKSVKFNLKKIVSAIRRAGESSGEFGYDEALDLTNDVIQKFDGKEEASVEEIQDAVEDVLSESGYKKTAKAYILYREQHSKLRNDNVVMVDAIKSIDDYLDRSDWRVNANANQGYSLGGMILNTSGKVTANYWLSHVYPKEAGEGHRNGDIQIHDLDMLSSYCTGWSLRSLLQEGFNGVPGKVESNPPKHLGSALGQMVNFWGCFTDDTRIRKSDFSSISFREIIDQGIEELEVLSYNDNSDMLEPAIMNNFHKTRTVDQTIELTFEGDKKVRCTLDHKFWVWDKNWVEAKDLTEDDDIACLGVGESISTKLVSKKIINETKDVYCGTVQNEYHSFLLESGLVVHNCLQNENAGAQAFSSFDTYLAPYVRNDKLTYKQVYDAIQEFVFNVNVPSRWGCVLPDTEILTKDGWKKYTELKLAEDIIGFRDGELVDDVVNKINEFNFEGKLVRIKTASSEQILTPTHRVIGKGVDENFYTVNAEDFFTKRELKLPVLCEDLKSVKYEEVESVELYDYEGKVWCPSTDCTYWVAKNGSSVFITGNTQTPFTNITLDWTCPEDLKDSQPIIAGEEMDYTYSELQPEMDMINKAFIEVMMKGDAKGRLFTFPIPTYNITPDFPWESENTTLLFEMTAKYGLPYFQNFLNSDLKVGDVRSMCCRLQLDLREIRKRGGGLFGSGEQTGSVGVITINCARLGYLFKGDLIGLYKQLDHWMGVAKNALEQKRKVLVRWMEQGLYPYSKRYLGTYNTLFSTIGINGVNEMIRNFTNDEHDITDDYGQNFAIKLMDHMRDVMVKFQVETGNLYNIEATPGEGTTFRFAKEDSKRFSDIIQAGTKEAPYYTNSTQLPVGYTDDPFTALNLQEELQKRYTGGCVEAGNYVITNRGTLLIEDIVNNFDKNDDLYVASYNKETNKTEWDKVIDAVEIDVSQKDKINIKGEGTLNITTSDWHPFFVLQKDGSVIEKRADELKKNDKLLTANTCLFDDEPRDLTEEQAYLIGYFIGDGCITKRIDNRGGNHLERFMVRFFDDNIEILEKIRCILKNNNLGDVSIIQTDRRSKKLKEVHANSKSCYDFFFKYGFHAGSKTYTACIPDEVKVQLNRKNAYALLSGLIDSDSHVDKNGDVEYMTASLQLGYDIVWLCTMLGINVSKTFKVDKRWPNTTLSRVHVWHNDLIKLKGLMSTVKNLPEEQTKPFTHSKLTPKFNFARVKEVSKINVENNLFYDLTTEKNHNYLCGKDRFVFIHNTVLHLYMGERVSSPEVCKTLVRRVLENYRVPYITITPTFSICPKHGYISGEHKYCPICDEELSPPKLNDCDDCK